MTLLAASVYGQEASLQPSDRKQPAVEEVTAEDIDAALEQVGHSEDLGDSTKSLVKELYAKAQASLNEITKQHEAATKFKGQIESAEGDIKAEQQRKDSPPQAYNFDGARGRDLSELTREVAALEEKLAEAKKSLLEAQAEPQRRVKVIADIPTALTAARKKLAETEAELAGLASDRDPPIVMAARRTMLQAARQEQRAVIAALESERDAYKAQGELPRLKIDVAMARVNQIEQDILRLMALVSEMRKKDAAAQKEDAEAAMRVAPELLKPYAKENVDLADRRLEIAGDIKRATAVSAEIGQQLRRWQDDFARTEERAELVSSDTLGPMLLERRAKLPSAFQLDRQRAENEARLRAAQSELYDWEDRRAELSDLEAALDSAIAKLREEGREPPADARDTLKDLFTSEVQILDDLLDEAIQHYSAGIKAKEDQQELSQLVGEYRQFIDERVFWVRTAPTEISGVHAREAFAKLANGDTWREAASAFLSSMRTRPFGERALAVVLIASPVFLIVLRRRLRSKLEDLGRTASATSCRTMAPTTQALLVTMLLAAPVPMVFWCCGWGLAGASDPLVRSASTCFLFLTVGLFTLEFFRQVCRPLGLGQAHFDWSARSMSVTRANLRMFLLVGLPFAILCCIFQLHGNPRYQASIGRLCFLAFLLLCAFTLYRTLRAKNGVLAERLEQRPDGALARYHEVWLSFVVLVPVALGLLSISGFHHTAIRITVGLVRAIALVFLLSALGALLFRWVRIKRRRIRWQQLNEARERSANDEESEMSELEELAAREEEVDLVAMDHQMRRLILALLSGLGLFLLWLIWGRDLAAFVPLLQQKIWGVTFGAIVWAVAIAGITVLASRDIPGLVDVVLLGRLGIESATRYVISTLSQYAIVALGLLAAAHLLGATWSNTQWLIAALSVGLGFGLQEVVANFVCGILLLFERPIRVGDVVTLGETTGAVVRIRTRATTIRNWDRQEVVIPNKELITGRIVNWTLSDELNRIVIHVGIAYGSDTNQARGLLQQIVGANTNILDDPHPLVTFEQFGESTLVFVVRAYLANMDERMETIHRLHTEIHQRFAKEGIEIAVPQRDLHLRSIDKSARLSDRDSDVEGVTLPPKVDQ